MTLKCPELPLYYVLRVAFIGRCGRMITMTEQSSQTAIRNQLRLTAIDLTSCRETNVSSPEANNNLSPVMMKFSDTVARGSDWLIWTLPPPPASNTRGYNLPSYIKKQKKSDMLTVYKTGTQCRDVTVGDSVDRNK